jgi:hypothetical protein
VLQLRQHNNQAPIPYPAHRKWAFKFLNSTHTIILSLLIVVSYIYTKIKSWSSSSLCPPRKEYQVESDKGHCDFAQGYNLSLSIQHYGNSKTQYLLAPNHADTEQLFSISNANSRRGLNRFFSKKAFIIGNPEFDKRFVIATASPALMQAFLTKQVQQTILKAAKRCKIFSFTNRRTSFLPSSSYSDHYVRDIIHKTKDLYTHYQTISRSTDRLINLLKSETTLEAQRALLGQILVQIPPKTIKPLQHHLPTMPTAIQLEAILKLGVVSLDYGCSLLAKASDVTASETCKEVLEPQHMQKLLPFLANYKTTRSLPILKALLADTTKPIGLHQIILEHLPQFPTVGPDFNPLCVQFLTHKEPTIVSLAALALGKTGTIAHIEALYNLSTTSRNPGIINATKAAMAAIQSRLGPADKGWVSIAESTSLHGAISSSNSE